VKLQWTPGAVSDLGEIFNYLNQRNPEAARRTLRVIGLAADRLPRAPLSDASAASLTPGSLSSKARPL